MAGPFDGDLKQVKGFFEGGDGRCKAALVSDAGSCENKRGETPNTWYVMKGERVWGGDFLPAEPYFSVSTVFKQ